MPRSPGERSDTQAELARIRETLARLRAAPDRDEARIGALEMRVL